MSMTYEIEASEWLNTDQPLSLAQLRGRVVVVSVFQMLCPGCVQASIPQARNLHATFPREELVVIGLHSVFEHHEAMTPVALRAFVHEYKLQFPIAIDRPAEDSAIPVTMRRWALNGTPSMLVFDRSGERALGLFGHMDDLRLGALIGRLIGRPVGPHS